MAEITQITVTRKFNLGNYQTLDIGLVATITSSDDVEQVAKAMDDKIIKIRDRKINLKA